MIGKSLAHYRITGRLGSGGMGEVLAAEDTRLGRRVALKVLPERMAADPENRRRFEREARAVAALNHANIVTIHSVEEAEGVHFLTMELVEGSKLSLLIPEGGMPLERWLELAIPLADAVAAAHRAGITHRDLKPDNVMVDHQGRVKVLDFGLAKVVDRPGAALAAASDHLTQEGRILGTAPTCRPSRSTANRWTLPPTCSPSASSCTRWRPVSARSPVTATSRSCRQSSRTIHRRSRRSTRGCPRSLAG